MARNFNSLPFEEKKNWGAWAFLTKIWNNRDDLTSEEMLYITGGYFWILHILRAMAKVGMDEDIQRGILEVLKTSLQHSKDRGDW